MGRSVSSLVHDNLFLHDIQVCPSTVSIFCNTSLVWLEGWDAQHREASDCLMRDYALPPPGVGLCLFVLDRIAGVRGFHGFAA